MKKILFTLLVVLLVFSLVACAGDASTEASSSETEESSGYRAVYCTMTSEGDYWQMLENGIAEDLATKGIDFNVVSADADAVRQVEQIENAVTDGYDLILLFAVDPGAVADACKKAIEEGVIVYAFIKDPGEEYRTSFRGTDETYVGQQIVALASEWATETLGGADGSVNTIIVGGSGAGSETERYEAIVEAANADPQLNILEATRVETSQSASQTATENLFAKYDTINLIIYASGEMALGGMEYIESENSPLEDFLQFGIFTSDMSEETANDMIRAETNEGVIRGTVVNGGTVRMSAEGLSTQIAKLLNGEDYAVFDKVEVGLVTYDNLSDYGY